MTQNTDPTLQSDPVPKLLTVRQFVDRHAWATEGGLRHLIFHADSNGFGKCVRRIGRRVLISEGDFFAWVGEQNPNGGPADG